MFDIGTLLVVVVATAATQEIVLLLLINNEILQKKTFLTLLPISSGKYAETNDEYRQTDDLFRFLNLISEIENRKKPKVTNAQAQLRLTVET